MSRLLGAIAESGSMLDPERLWRVAARHQARGSAMWVADRSGQRTLTIAHGEQVAADCAFLLPDRGQQDEDIWVGLDGVLYNLRELQEQSKGPHRQSCDEPIEVVRRCYQRWGAPCFARFRGSFACAVVDLRNRKLLLARDHLGSRSLFFTTRCGFHFASTLEAVLDISGLPRRVNRPMLREWLLDAANDDRSQTFFDGIVRLPSATTLEVDLSGSMLPTITDFWPIDDVDDRSVERKEAEERLRMLLAESIELSTRDLRSVGVTLSGGLDSSLLLATLRKCKGKGYPIHSFTSVSDTCTSRREAFSACAVTELCQSEGHLVGYDCQRIPGEIDELFRRLEEPIASPVVFAHRELYRAAYATGVRAVLNGHGSDSLFAGSNSHLLTVAASLCRRGRAIRACTMLAKATSGNRRVQMFKSLAGAGLPPRLKAVLRRRRNPEWIRYEWFEESRAVAADPRASRAGALRRQLICELRARSVPRTLRIEESASEAYSVSVRSPFLSPEVVEFALALPEEFLIDSDGYTKSILRSASTDLLPITIRKARERVGFSIPAAEWLRCLAPWAAEELAESRQLPFLDACSVQKHWELFQRSGAMNWQLAMLLWRLIFLTRWSRVVRAEF